MKRRRSWSTKCTLCPIDFFSRGPIRVSCFRSRPGFTTGGPGAKLCQRIGLPCPLGTFTNANSNCDRCGLRSRLDPQKKNVSLVNQAPSIIKLSAQIVRPFCRDNDRMDRKQPSVLKVRKTCEWAVVRNVPQAHFATIIFLTKNNRQYKCRFCYYGEFADKPGSLSCNLCPSGTVVDKHASSSCRSCPPGSIPEISTYEGEGARRCVDVRTGCLPGWARKDNRNFRGPGGATYGCIRIACTVGTPTRDVMVKCVLCKPGERVNNEKKICISCRPGKISPGGFTTN